MKTAANYETTKKRAEALKPSPYYMLIKWAKLNILASCEKIKVCKNGTVAVYTDKTKILNDNPYEPWMVYKEPYEFSYEDFAENCIECTDEKIIKAAEKYKEIIYPLNYRKKKKVTWLYDSEELKESDK